MRLIDADALMENVLRADCVGGWNPIIQLIVYAPTIEAVPVRKGYWFFSSTDFLTHCSACGTGKWKGYCPTPEEATEWMPICPQCGADMRGETE